MRCNARSNGGVEVRGKGRGSRLSHSGVGLAFLFTGMVGNRRGNAAPTPTGGAGSQNTYNSLDDIAALGFRFLSDLAFRNNLQ